MKPLHKHRFAMLLLTILIASSQLVLVPRASFAAADDAPKKPAAQAAKPRPFATADEAMQAFAAAVKADDVASLRAMFGKEGEAVLQSGDPLEDKAARQRFTAAYDEFHRIDEQSRSKARILVGKDEWPFPVPLRKAGSAWYFDMRAGKQELLNRRIGRNELSTIQAALAYVDAQQEYYQRNPQAEPLPQYAQQFVSSANKRDGLYFPTRAGEKPSPLGPLFDARRAAGYVEDTGGKPGAYHGYHYKILKGQGPKAPGGAYEYVVNGRMIGGFALAAYPASYGNSGVMTFMVNHDGVVYEKNLGPDTAAIARKINRFDPDNTWKRR
jgi:hypothetical protein